MGIFDINGSFVDYRHPSLLPAARESRLFSHDQHTADAQSYANIIAFLQSNQSRETGTGGGGRDNNERTVINESSSVNQMNNPTRNYDNRNNNNNNNNYNDERKQHISSSPSSSVSDSIPLFGLEELSEADIDTDSFIDGFFHSHYILLSSPLVLSHPLASSSTINNNDNHNNNTSGPIRHNRTRVPAGFSLASSSSSPIIPSSLIAVSADDNNDNSLIEEELPVEFLQPPSSSPQPVIDYRISLLDGIQEFAAI